jgi:hypothetical protein
VIYYQRTAVTLPYCFQQAVMIVGSAQSRPQDQRVSIVLAMLQDGYSSLAIDNPSEIRKVLCAQT